MKIDTGTVARGIGYYHTFSKAQPVSMSGIPLDCGRCHKGGDLLGYVAAVEHPTSWLQFLAHKDISNEPSYHMAVYCTDCWPIILNENKRTLISPDL